MVVMPLRPDSAHRDFPDHMTLPRAYITVIPSQGVFLSTAYFFTDSTYWWSGPDSIPASGTVLSMGPNLALGGICTLGIPDSPVS